MTLSELENLLGAGKLKREPPDQDEFDGLVHLGEAKYRDAQVVSLSLAGRFDLAYGASHAFALAALRWHGYRSDFRYVVFQSLEHTLGVSRDIWRVLDKAHGARNAADYGGSFHINERLLRDMLAATTVVRQRALALGAIRSRD
ncbi:MAG: hypothetical protein JXA57_02070 [Armatimonadetes bacterium]|nr:hypothetical protein [Armatimonadota bacterium]